jgi:hypothetical protein
VPSRILKASLLLILPVFLLGVVWFLSPPMLASKLDNTCVRWRMEGGNVIPYYDSKVPSLIEMRGSACIPWLKQSLKDDSRFAAAHVLLVRLSGKPVKTGPDSWSGLSVRVEESGTGSKPRTLISLEQKDRLQRLWNAEE